MNSTLFCLNNYLLSCS